MECWLGILIDCIVHGDPGLCKDIIEKGSDKGTGELFLELCNEVRRLGEKKDAIALVDQTDSTLTTRFLQLLSEATKVWATYAHDECPDEKWLASYLEVKMAKKHYVAWSKVITC